MIWWINRLLRLSYYGAIGLIVAGVFAAASASLAGENRPPGSVSAAEMTQGKHWPHEVSDLTPDPEAIFGRLPNGFGYVILPNSKPRGRTRLHLIVQAGSLHESEAQRGVAHFLEHMLFNGSTHFQPGELVRYFQKIGMQFGPDANARTSFYDTVYDINLPKSDRENLQEALLVMQDYAEGALLLPSEIERERGVVLAEKRTRDSADYRAYVASLRFELDGTRFPERLPIGAEEVIGSADRATFTSFYDTWYRPDNMILVMVGDFDPQLARNLIEDRFGGMTARAEAQALPPIGSLTHEGLEIFYHPETELGTASVTLQVLDKVPSPRDDSDFRRRQIEAYLANQIIRHRLNRKINQPGSPLTDAGAGSGIYLQQFRYGYISADCLPGDWKAALALIEQELRQALQYGFTEGELERVTKAYRAGLAQAMAQAKTRDSADLARELVYSVTQNQVFRSPVQENAFTEPILDALTAEDLLERLRDVWRPDHRLVLVTGNVAIASAAGSPEDEIASVFKSAQAVTVQPPVQQERVVFPYLEPPSGNGRIAARQDIDGIGVSMLRFANGVRLNVKATDFTDDEVQFVLSFGQGRAGVPPEAPALAVLAEDVVNESGLGQLDKEALAQALAGKKTAIRFAVYDDRFALEGRSAPEEIELVFQLLQAYVMDPAFRENAWYLALNRFTQAYRSAMSSVDGVMDLHGWRFLAGGDPRFGLPPLEDFEGLSAADVERWIVPALRGGFMELAVVGDVDPETVSSLASRYLGSLAERGDDLLPGLDLDRRGPDFPEARLMEVPVPSQVDKALLIMALPTDDIWDIGRTRRLNILAEIISERLRLRIREELGAAYSTGAYHWPSRTYPEYGMLVIHIPPIPDMMDRVETEVKAILRAVQEKGVGSDEMQRALEPTLAGIRDRFRENDYWLDTVLVGASRHPEQLAWSQTILDDYTGITREEINALARTYLTISDMAVIRARAVNGE